MFPGLLFKEDTPLPSVTVMMCNSLNVYVLDMSARDPIHCSRGDTRTDALHPDLPGTLYLKYSIYICLFDHLSIKFKIS